MRRVCSRVTHTRLSLPGVAERNYRLCHISMRGGAGLSRLSPLRVGCLRLAPIGTRFCFLLVLYPRKPVPACTSPEHWIWCRRLDSNQRHTSWRGALPTELRLH